MINHTDIVKNIKSIYDSKSSLDILLEFEKILDETHIYAYKNWIEGEVVEGPEINKYWVTVTLMYPYKLMPDPSAAKRLISHGCKVEYKKIKYIISAEITSPEDMEMEALTGKRKPKKEHVNVWFVKIKVPRHLIDEYNTEKLEINGVTLDMSSIKDASDNDLDTVKNVSGDNNEDI
jgi:hypothetical protein